MEQKVESLLYANFVKYDRLEEIVFNTFSNTSIASATELNIFIDLYSVLHSIYSEHYRTQITDYTSLTSILINMCGHYRSFFRKLGVETSIFLIGSINTCEINRKFVGEYNVVFKAKTEIPLFRDFINNNFDLLELLCPYIPSVYFVRSQKNFESSVIISFIIDSLNDGKPNLIISKDIYPMQLCSIHPYTSFLKPKKSKIGTDESIMIPISEKPSYRMEFWNLYASVRGIDAEQLYNISPVNLSLLSALYKFPERNLHKVLMPVSKAIQTIANISTDNIKITPDILLNSGFLDPTIPFTKIDSYYKVLDVLFMKNYYKSDPESKTLRFQNLRDDAALQHLNSKFFPNNPINLFAL